MPGKHDDVPSSRGTCYGGEGGFPQSYANPYSKALYSYSTGEGLVGVAGSECGKIAINLESFLQEARTGVKRMSAIITLTGIDKTDDEADMDDTVILSIRRSD